MANETGVSVADLTGRYYPPARFGNDPALQPALAASAAGTDSTFSCNGINVSARIAAQGSPIWGYEFRDQTAPSLVGSFGGSYRLSLPQGAGHASELSYIFNMVPLSADEQKALAAAMSAYWANFAKTGNPNGAGLPTWAAFNTGKLQALDVKSGGGVTAITQTAFAKAHQCGTAWKRLAF